MYIYTYIILLFSDFTFGQLHLSEGAAVLDFLGYHLFGASGQGRVLEQNIPDMNVLVILGYLWWISRDELFFDPEDRIYTYQESEFEGVSSRLTGKGEVVSTCFNCVVFKFLLTLEEDLCRFSKLRASRGKASVSPC